MPFVEDQVQWLNLVLLLTLSGVLVLFPASRLSGLRPLTRLLSRFILQSAAVLAVAWLLVTVPNSGRVVVHDNATHLARVISNVAAPSVALIVLAIFFGSGLGLSLAITVTAAQHKGLRILGVLATIVWVIPTFMVAILAQEAQAQIYQVSGVSTVGGYGQVTPLTLFWAAVVLGIRPAAYVYRQARAALELESIADHVRAGRARGLPERVLSLRYIVRPASGALIAGWLNSIRVVVGALPLVEFFFAYPGIGQTLLLALGIHYENAAPNQDPDLAIAAAFSLAVLLLLLESAALAARLVLDPRLHESQAA